MLRTVMIAMLLSALAAAAESPSAPAPVSTPAAAPAAAPAKPAAPYGPGPVYVLTLDDEDSPGSAVIGLFTDWNANYLRRSLKRAEQGGASLFIVRLTTNGGLVLNAFKVSEALRAVQGMRTATLVKTRAISAGALLANAGMLDGLNVSLFPAYGAEMRGGTANCSVVVSSEEVASPIVTTPDTVIVMNEPSLARWEKEIRPGGLMIINSSLVNSKHTRKDIKVVYAPCNQIAAELGTVKIANAVALGAFARHTGAISAEALIKALPKVYKKAKPEVLELNAQAIKKGFDLN